MECSGYVELKRKLNKQLIRETLEETKIELDVASVKFLEPVFTRWWSILRLSCGNRRRNRTEIDEEHSDWGYFSIDDLPSPITKELHNDVLSVLSNDKTE